MFGNILLIDQDEIDYSYLSFGKEKAAGFFAVRRWRDRLQVVMVMVIDKLCT